MTNQNARVSSHARAVLLALAHTLAYYTLALACTLAHTLAHILARTLVHTHTHTLALANPTRPTSISWTMSFRSKLRRR